MVPLVLQYPLESYVPPTVSPTSLSHPTEYQKNITEVMSGGQLLLPNHFDHENLIHRLSNAHHAGNTRAGFHCRAHTPYPTVLQAFTAASPIGDFHVKCQWVVIGKGVAGWLGGWGRGLGGSSRVFMSVCLRTSPSAHALSLVDGLSREPQTCRLRGVS